MGPLCQRRHRPDLHGGSACRGDLGARGSRHPTARRPAPLHPRSGRARDVEPAVGQLENVFLYDIDDLQAVAAHAAAERHHEVPAAERIVSDEVERFWVWYGGLAAVPVLKEFRGRLDDMRAAELERTLKGLAHLSPEDRAQVEQFSHALLNKFLHHPTIALKQAAQAGRGYGLLESLKKLFGLERHDGP